MMRIVFIWLLVTSALVVGVPFFIGWSDRSMQDAASVQPSAMAAPLIRLYRSGTGEVLELPLEEYVYGVVAAEMPAEFPPEALRAQAVAARTYAVQQMRSFGGAGLAELSADISDSPQVNQAWCDEVSLRKRWGSRYEEYRQKLRAAVEVTAGRVICYEGRPIAALFHAASAGRTASAAEVWGSGDYPYLQSVAAPERRDDARIRRVKQIAWTDFVAALGETALPVAAGSEPVKIVAYTDSGRVASLKVGDRQLSGSEARRLWGLRSTDFQAKYADGLVTITTYGYGHGVGLSQYGAAELAKQGRSYAEILSYFYRGTELRSLADLS